MKTVKSLLAAFLVSTVPVTQAATYSYTDLGLSYSINTDNPLITKATFDATSLDVAQSTGFSVTPTTSASVTINAFTLLIPSIGPSGLQITPDGKAIPRPTPQPQVQAQVSGTFTEDWSWNGVSGSHSGSWNQLITFNLNLPTINIWDFPNSAPLLTGYSASSGGPAISLLNEPHNVPTPSGSGVLTLKLGINGINLDQNGNATLSIYNYPSIGPLVTPIPSSIFLFGTSLAGLIASVARKRMSR